MPEVNIKETGEEHLQELLAIYPKMFPEEDLTPLVTALLDGLHPVLSLAAFDGQNIVGHILFSLFNHAGTTGAGALLGPLGVIPGHQGKRVGSNLINTGCKRLARDGVQQIFVLGDPAYYGRFNFRREDKIIPPYKLPMEWAGAWQSLTLSGGTASKDTSLAAGKCTLPEPWMKPALWLP